MLDKEHAAFRRAASPGAAAAPPSLVESMAKTKDPTVGRKRPRPPRVLPRLPAKR